MKSANDTKVSIKMNKKDFKWSSTSMWSGFMYEYLLIQFEGKFECVCNNYGDFISAKVYRDGWSDSNIDVTTKSNCPRIILLPLDLNFTH